MLTTLSLVLLAGAADPADPGRMPPSSLIVPPVPREEQTTGADLNALVAEYREAEKAWIEKLRAAPEEEQAALFAEHPAPTFWPRFRALAEGGQLGAWEWLVENSFNAEKDAAEVCREAFAAAGSLPSVVAAACSMLEGYADVLDRTRSIEILGQALSEVPDDASRAQCATTMGILMCGSDDAGKRDEGLALLRSIAAEYEGEEVGQRAADELFRVERLCLGAVAPDFEGTSIDGEPLSLSGERGKVVVLDFFGFW